MGSLQAGTGPTLSKGARVIHQFGVSAGGDIVPWGRVALAVPDDIRMAGQASEIPAGTTAGQSNNSVNGNGLDSKPCLPSSLPGGVSDDHDIDVESRSRK